MISITKDTLIDPCFQFHSFLANLAIKLSSKALNVRVPHDKETVRLQAGRGNAFTASVKEGFLHPSDGTSAADASRIRSGHYHVLKNYARLIRITPHVL